MVDRQEVGAIGRGILVLVGVAEGDGESDAAYIAGKIVDLRLFSPAADADTPEQSLAEIGGEALIVSQFTLLGDARKGRRPSWSAAAQPAVASGFYERVVELVRQRGIRTETGTFRAHMQVELVNDGPVTILIDSRRLF